MYTTKNSVFQKPTKELKEGSNYYRVGNSKTLLKQHDRAVYCNQEVCNLFSEKKNILLSQLNMQRHFEVYNMGLFFLAGNLTYREFNVTVNFMFSTMVNKGKPVWKR